MAEAILAVSETGDVYGRVYCITNLVNGKQYVGQTIRPLSARWGQHGRLKGGCRALSNAIKLYGRASFEHAELGVADSQTALDDLEIFWIRKLNTLSPSGYNLISGGNGGGPMAEETKKRMRDRVWAKMANDPAWVENQRVAARIAWQSPECRARHIAAQSTAEFVEKMSAANKARWAVPENRQKWGETMRTALNKPDVHKRKVEHSLAVWASPGHKEKMAARMAMPETKRRLAVSNAAPKTKAQRSESARKMWERPGHAEKVRASRAATAARKRAAKCA